jgi:RNA ligase (TIGR02306 family)
MSEFTCPVIKVSRIEKHPNADSLSMIKVYGETVVFRTGDFQEDDLAVYVPVDAVVPYEIPGTEFLGDHRRIKARKLRGIYSEGLLLPASVVSSPTLGRDQASVLKIRKYEDVWPEEMQARKVSRGSSDQASDPGCVPHYDIEQFGRHPGLIKLKEEVVVTEKLHGTQARFVYLPSKGLMVGSHNCWWKNDRKPFTAWEHARILWGKITGNHYTPYRPSKTNTYWESARVLGLEQKLKTVPGIAMYGEIFGPGVQDLHYGIKVGGLGFRCFDAYNTKTKKWLSWGELVGLTEVLGIDRVPVLYRGPIDFTSLGDLVEGKSTLGDHIREGIVVKPIDSRVDEKFGRVILKWVSQAYKLRKNGTEYH